VFSTLLSLYVSQNIFTAMNVPFLFYSISLSTVETVVALYGISSSPFFHALGKARKAVVLSSG
jgi:hypothetical protein